MRSVVLALPLLAVAAPAGALSFETHRVAERVVVVRCGSNNVGAIASSRGVIVVDTHRSPTLMKVLAGAMAAELGRGDVRFVVNTHGHWDHTSGNQVFAEATVIGHALCREYVAASRLGSPRSRWAHARRLADLAKSLAECGDSTKAARIREDEEIERTVVEDLSGDYVATPPTEVFTDRAEIDGGDLSVELIHCGEAHTDHDVLVWIPQERALFTGDVFCSASAFCFGVHALVDVPRLVSVLDEILASGPDEIVVVPGHGDFLTREDLRRLRDLARERFAGVRVDDSAARFLADRVERDGWPAALEALGAAMRESPDRWYVAEEELAVLTERWEGRGLVDESRALLEWAVERAPDSPLLWSRLCEVRRRGGDAPAARRACERALELEPQLHSAADELEWLETTARTATRPSPPRRSTPTSPPGPR